MLAAPNSEGAILAPAGKYRQSRNLSERIETYPNGLSCFGDLNGETLVLLWRTKWRGLCVLAYTVAKYPTRNNFERWSWELPFRLSRSWTDRISNAISRD